MSTFPKHVMRTRGMRLVAGTAAVLLAAGSAAMWDSTALASPPDNLAVFYASSVASPEGVVSRVPAETDGGYLLSQSSVQLGKSQGLAAGFTLGQLGDAFVVTSAPPGTITQMPSVVTAQDPPSETAPNEASLSGGNGGGASVGGEVRNADLNARATGEPTSQANASGQSVKTSVYNTGSGISHSDSAVLPDGTVVTHATTSVHNVMIGGPTGLLIASIDSLASITIKPAQKPVTALQVHTNGASLAGVPVIIDGNGIRISDQVPVPASSVKTFNDGLAGLAAQGLTFIASTSDSQVTDSQATLHGNAFSFRYQLPNTQIPRPSDIGSDETFEYGKVAASATSRVNGSLGAGPDLTSGAPTNAAGAPGAANAAPPAGVDAVGLPSTVPGALPGALPGGVATTTLTPASDSADPVGFALPAKPSLAPNGFKDGYRYLLLAAALALGGLVVIVRNRPVV